MNETLLILKPDSMIRPRVGAEILHILLIAGYKPTAVQIIKDISPEMITNHYRKHRFNKRFEWLIKYMTCGPIMVLKLTDNTNNTPRNLCMFAGSSITPPTKPYQIRATYYITEFINSIHTSDSNRAARREINLWDPYLKQEVHSPINPLNYVKKYIKKYAPDLKQKYESNSILQFTPHLKELRQRIIQIRKVAYMLENTDKNSNYTHKNIEQLSRELESLILKDTLNDKYQGKRLTEIIIEKCIKFPSKDQGTICFFSLCIGVFAVSMIAVIINEILY